MFFAEFSSNTPRFTLSGLNEAAYSLYILKHAKKFIFITFRSPTPLKERTTPAFDSSITFTAVLNLCNTEKTGLEESTAW